MRKSSKRDTSRKTRRRGKVSVAKMMKQIPALQCVRRAVGRELFEALVEQIAHAQLEACEIVGSHYAPIAAACGGRGDTYEQKYDCGGHPIQPERIPGPSSLW